MSKNNLKMTASGITKAVVSAYGSSVFEETVVKIFINLYNTAEGDFRRQDRLWREACSMVDEYLEAHGQTTRTKHDLFRSFVDTVRKKKGREPVAWLDGLAPKVTIIDEFPLN